MIQCVLICGRGRGARVFPGRRPRIFPRGSAGHKFLVRPEEQTPPRPHRNISPGGGGCLRRAAEEWAQLRHGLRFVQDAVLRPASLTPLRRSVASPRKPAMRSSAGAPFVPGKAPAKPWSRCPGATLHIPQGSAGRKFLVRPASGVPAPERNGTNTLPATLHLPAGKCRLHIPCAACNPPGTRAFPGRQNKLPPRPALC